MFTKITFLRNAMEKCEDRCAQSYQDSEELISDSFKFIEEMELEYNFQAQLRHTHSDLIRKFNPSSLEARFFSDWSWQMLQKGALPRQSTAPPELRETQRG